MSPSAAAGILRRAERRGKSLPGPLQSLLESLAGPGWREIPEEELQAAIDEEEARLFGETWDSGSPAPSGTAPPASAGTGETLTPTGRTSPPTSPGRSTSGSGSTPPPTGRTFPEGVAASLTASPARAQRDPAEEPLVADHPTIGFHPHERMDAPRDDGRAPTLMKSAAPSTSTPAGALRRLTPTECLLPGELILGDDKPIEAYAAGDGIMTASGHGRVLAAMRRAFEGEVVTVRACGMLPVSATPEHPVLAAEGVKVGGRGGRQLSDARWLPIGELRPWNGERGDFLVMPRLAPEPVDAIDLEEHVSDVRGHAKLRRTRGLPREMPLTVDAAWLLGLYVAEGCVHDRASGGYAQLTPGPDEALARRAADGFREIGFTASVRRMRTSWSVNVPSAPLARMLAARFGSGARAKRIDESVLLAEPAVLRAFLDGYLAGDGYERAGANVDGANTASPTLALHLQLAMARLGKFARLGRFERDGGVIDGRRIGRFAAWAATWSREAPARSRYMMTEDAFATPVVSASRRAHEGEVHNVETTDNTYLVSNAVVHNCERLMGWPDGYTVMFDKGAKK